MDQLTTAEVAKRGGVNLETIRYYERRGLLPKPRRTVSGYRAFAPDAVRRLRFVKRAQALGFSLKEIKELLSLRAAPKARCADIRERAEVKIAEIDAKIRSLQAMRKALLRLTAACTGRGSVSDCPILESLDFEEDDHGN
jgi:MerR family mercuric resistance operon transcriptional regulator